MSSIKMWGRGGLGLYLPEEGEVRVRVRVRAREPLVTRVG